MAERYISVRFLGKLSEEKGEKTMKEDEKQPVTWEIADPKPPVIQSGRLENRKQN